MFFTDAFIESIPVNPVASVIEICNKALDATSHSDNWSEENTEILLEALALLSAMEDEGLLSTGLYTPEANGEAHENCNRITQYLMEVRKVKQQDKSVSDLRSMRQRFGVALSGRFAYEFSAADISRVQQLISELRENIAASDMFEDKHRARLLARLEALQAELHKRISDLDKFWGLIGDAGVALGKFGNDAKPIVDRMKEIAAIVWNTQARAEDLPSSTPLPLLTDESASRKHSSEEDEG